MENIDEYTNVPVPKNLRHELPYSHAMVWEIRAARMRRQKPGESLREKLFSLKIASDELRVALYHINDKVARKLTKAFQYKGLRKALEDDYFHLEGDGNISFLPKPPADNGNSGWPDGKRTVMRPGRFVRRFLRSWYAKNITDNELNEFASKLKAYALEKRVQVKVLPVWEAYSFPATDFSSCMQGKPVEEFYSEIGVGSCVCVVGENSFLLGRALIWEDNSIIPGCNGFVDRIYGQITAELLIKQWAHKNGFAYKRRQSNDSYELVLPNWECVTIKFLWRAELPRCDFYPYMDTLNCYSQIEKAFGTPTSLSEWSFRLRNTDGKL